MALRDKTPQDLPASQKFGWWMIPFTSTVTRDANGLLQSVENSFDNGSRPCGTVDSTKRHTISKVNGYDCAVSTDTSRGGILLQNMTGIPSGNADLCMIFIQMPQDGVVGGFRGGNNYWVDNPYPDYRMRTEKGDFTGSGATNTTSLHTLIVNRKNGVTTMRVDGTTRGTQTPSGGYNTTLGSFGIKGADANYYVMKGATLGAMLLKQAASDDDIYFLEAYFARYTGQPIPSDNPYRGALPQVDDGTSPSTITGAASGALAGLGAAAAGSLAILGAAAQTLGAIGGGQTGSAPITAQATAPLYGISSASVSGAPVSATANASLGVISSGAAGALPVGASASALLGPVASASASTAPLTGAAAQTVGSVSTVSASRADISGTALSGLAAIVGSASGHVDAPGGATTASTLSPIGTTASGQAIATGSAAVQLGSVSAASIGAVASRAASIMQLSAIGGTSSGSSAIGAAAGSSLAHVAASASSVAGISGSAALTLPAIGGVATATGRNEPFDHIPGPGWAQRIAIRNFDAVLKPRSFHVSRTGTLRMINLPQIYSQEAHKASVDFAPGLAADEALTGEPWTEVEGAITIDDVRIEGAKVLYTLRGKGGGGLSLARFVIYCKTTVGQTLGAACSLVINQ